jgi:nucleoside-diphosphate-sugar epimerase
MKIFITGINGFLGSHLASHLIKNGHLVSGFSRAKKVTKDLNGNVGNYHSYHLLKPIPDFFKNQDIIIHAAHSIIKNNYFSTNVRGTKDLYFKALQSGVKTQIFISSYSAKKNSPSKYSVVKYELEDFFLQNSQPVIKPGLVLGKGGLLKSIYSSITKLPLVPLAGSGKFKIPVVSVPVLLSAILHIINSPQPETFNIFNQHRVTLREIANLIKRESCSKTFFLPIPFKPLLFFSRIIEKLKIPFPFTSDGLLGLKQFETIKLSSDLPKLGIKQEPIEAIIHELIQSMDIKN